MIRKVNFLINIYKRKYKAHKLFDKYQERIKSIKESDEKVKQKTKKTRNNQILGKTIKDTKSSGESKSSSTKSKTSKPRK